MNGYFQISNEAAETFLILYPATDGGVAVDVTEAVDYLNSKGIEYSLPVVYGHAKKLGKEPLKIPLHKGKGRPEQEMLKVRISSDGMSASVCFYAPSNDGATMDKDEIINDLRHRGVRYGVKADVLDNFLNNRRYCEFIEIAVGDPAVQGDGGKVEYFFNTNPKINPTLNDDGSVDFFNLNVIENVKKGQLLAKLTPPTPPQTGRNVKDEILKPTTVKMATIKFGKNTVISADKTELVAACDGHVRMEGERIRVEDVLRVSEVGNATGNIDFEGSVEVVGNVCENFSVRAGGNVTVGGVIEGATVEAGGDIIITRGMNGMGKGILHAGGNVVSKFFENATVNAGVMVQSESIINSQVSAGDVIKVDGRKGNITGGRTQATNGVEAKNIGSSTGGNTVIEVGANPKIKTRIAEINKTLADNVEVMNKTKPIIASVAAKIKSGAAVDKEHLAYVKKLNDLYNMKQKECETLSDELDTLRDELQASKTASVKVWNDVAPGTVIAIGELSMTVKALLCHCKFVVDRGDVKMMGI